MFATGANGQTMASRSLEVVGDANPRRPRDGVGITPLPLSSRFDLPALPAAAGRWHHLRRDRVYIRWERATSISWSSDILVAVCVLKVEQFPSAFASWSTEWGWQGAWLVLIASNNSCWWYWLPSRGYFVEINDSKARHRHQSTLLISHRRPKHK